jgi:subfamily B ATP-binding cassette protein MsbA
LLARRGRYRQLYDKQYMIEHDRFVNPGEDFTPDEEELDIPVRSSVRGPRDL